MSSHPNWMHNSLDSLENSADYHMFTLKMYDLYLQQLVRNHHSPSEIGHYASEYFRKVREYYRLFPNTAPNFLHLPPELNNPL